MNEIFQKALTVVINPIIRAVFAVAIILFVYGVFEFVRGAENADTRTKGQQHMLWGLIGLAIMFSVFTIIRILTNTLGVQAPTALPR